MSPKKEKKITRGVVSLPRGLFYFWSKLLRELSTFARKKTTNSGGKLRGSKRTFCGLVERRTIKKKSANEIHATFLKYF